MNIEINEKDKMIPFESLNDGEVFTSELENNVFMKTTEYASRFSTDLIFNAICFNDNSFRRFGPSSHVRPLKGKLVIEEY